MSGEPLVAVVTPFYNTDRYIEECIQSVLRQTYTNWRYILLDNCSTDGSLAIARRYADRDERIVLHEATEFVSQLPNFNRTLELIPPEAKYVKMVLADDFMTEHCLEQMVALAETHPEVIVVSGYSKVDRRVFRDGLPIDVSIVDGADALRYYLNEEVLLFGSPTSVMYRADAVRGRRPFFREHINFTDTDVVFDLLGQGKLGFVHQLMTFVRMHEGAFTPEFKKVDPGPCAIYATAYDHAPRLLPPEEAKAAIRRTRWEYYSQLGYKALRFPGSKFWKTHRQALRGIGQDFRWDFLAAHTLLAAGKELLMSPYTVSRSLARSVLINRVRASPSS